MLFFKKLRKGPYKIFPKGAFNFFYTRYNVSWNEMVYIEKCFT